MDVIQEKVDLNSSQKSPIEGEYIEKYLAEKDLDLTATIDGEVAYREMNCIVIDASANYDSKKISLIVLLSK